MAFSSISDLWNKWNIRSFVLLSLSFQVFLILFSPIRKKTANRHIISLLWFAYLMADWVATFAIGLISQNQGNLYAHATEVDGALQAFWASFLLLHLGGPDTITAFSLEDSSLWRRHLLSLILQISAIIYFFAQIFPSNRSLTIPTMLVFLVGVIKNAERTLALYLSSLPRLKEWVLSQHESFVCEDNKRVNNFDVSWNRMRPSASKGDEGESAVVGLAYSFFEIFKVFIGDLMFTRKEREKSYNCFAEMSEMEMLSVISVELQFIYEVLHTKALAIRSKLSYIFRFISFMGVVVAFIIFNCLKKDQLLKLDVKITHILLSGGIVLDLIALFMLIFSDWTLADIMQNDPKSSMLYSLLYDLADAASKLRKPRLATCKLESNANVPYKALDTPIIFRRWSESISACNLLSMTLKKSPGSLFKCDMSLGRIASSMLFDFPFHMVEKIIPYYHQAGEKIARGCGPPRGYIAMIPKTKYVSKNPFLEKLWIFIIKEVSRKSKSIYESTDRNEKELKKVRKIFKAKGDLFLESLRDRGEIKSLRDEIYYGNLLEFTKANYDDGIIMWHIATEIWYNKEKSTENRDEMVFSKILSDYMLYLFLDQPNVVAAVAGVAQMTAEETLKELLELHSMYATHDVEGLCEKLFDDPKKLLHKAKLSKSVLKKGTTLAREMKRLQGKKWKVMSGVWVEMLSYAAIHIKGEAHVQVLSKGGELLTFIWLLMAHFGCVYKPELGIYYERWGK